MSLPVSCRTRGLGSGRRLRRGGELECLTRSCTCTCTPSTRCSTAPPGSRSCSPRPTGSSMPALAMTDHGNLFGAYDFYKQATAAGVKPIIGLEAYLTPNTDRRDRVRVRWADGGENDVSGGGAYTHMTMLAADARRPAATCSGWARGPASRATSTSRGPTASCCTSTRKGLIATTGCPSGEVQTWLRIGDFEKACESAAEFQDIFGAGQLLPRADGPRARHRDPRPAGPAAPRQAAQPQAGGHQRPALHLRRRTPTRTRCCCACSPARRWPTRSGSSSTRATST